MGIIPTDTRVQADMRSSSVFLLFLAMAVPLAAEEPANDPAVLERLLAVQAAVSTVSGTFVQKTVRADDPEGGGTEYRGRFDLQAPDRYNLVYTNPQDEEWRLRHCSDGTTRWQIEQLFAGEKPEVTAKPVAGEAAGGGTGERTIGDVPQRIAALLRGDRTSLVSDFTVVVAAVGEGFALTLTPKPGPLEEHLVRVEVDLDGSAHVTALRFFDRQGNRVTVTVSDAVYGQTIPPETFSYTAP